MDKAQDLFQSVMHHLDYAYDALGELKKIQMQGRTEERSNAVSGQQVSESLKDTDKTVFPYLASSEKEDVLYHEMNACLNFSVEDSARAIDSFYDPRFEIAFSQIYRKPKDGEAFEYCEVRGVWYHLLELLNIKDGVYYSKKFPKKLREMGILVVRKNKGMCAQLTRIL